MRCFFTVLSLFTMCLAFGLGTLSCESCGCSEDGLIARLASTKGNVERDHSEDLEKWRPAANSARFFLGDGIRTKEKSGAVLDMLGGAELHVKESTKIRFMNEMPKEGAVGMDVESGEAEIVAGTEDLEIILSDADSAKVYKGGRVRLKKSTKGVDLQVKIGRADLLKLGKKAEELNTGQNIQIQFGAAELLEGLDTGSETEDVSEDTSSEIEAVAAAGTLPLEVIGSGAKIRSASDEDWQELEQGSGTILPGTMISLPKKTRVKLNRKGEKVTLVGAGEFRIGGSDEPIVRAGRGKVLIDSAVKPVTVVVPGGRITTADGSGESARANINAKNDGTDVKVQSGAVEVQTEEGTQLLQAGEKTTIEAVAKSPKSSSPQYETGSEFADFNVTAGESFVVHTAKPPVIIGFRIGDGCSGEAVITIDGKRGGTRGQGKINVTLSRGRSSYRVRCLDSEDAPGKEIVAKGRALVLRDSGKAKLPRKPPHSMIDLDGRNYKISYQNRLPIVKVRWPKAPEAESYSLAVTTASGKKLTINSKKPDHTFSSGKLGEGKHTLRFQGGGKQSRATTVQIRFDNAAPKASLTAPQEGGFSSGQTVAIKGIAIPGWTVSVPDGNVSMDEAHRFTGDVHYGGRLRGIALRLVQPGRGVHYYLRRASGASQ